MKEKFQLHSQKKDRLNHTFKIQSLNGVGKAKLMFSSSAKTKSVCEGF